MRSPEIASTRGKILGFAILVLSIAASNSNSSDWSVGILTGNTPYNLSTPLGLTNPVLTSRDVTDITATFIADPFMVYDNSVWYLFFEALNSQNGLGHIGLATSSDGIQWNYKNIVIKETFHTAYPYVFKWQNEYYLIPDTYANNSIRLYRAVNFPFQWEFVKELLAGPGYLDTSVVFFNNKWWLFTSVPSNDTLHLYYSDNVLGPWTKHPKSPIISGNAHIGRPGGRIVNYNGTLLRHAQDDVGVYGNAVHVIEITSLTTTAYSEREITGSPFLKASGVGWNSLGMHNSDPVQIAADNWVASVDGYGDPFYSPPAGVIPKSNWTLYYVDSQEAVGENGVATNAFDSSNTTIWHTRYEGANPPPPHEIQIDLGGNYNINGFRYLPRQDGSANGRIGKYEFYISPDGFNWGTLIASGTFANNATEKEIRFTSAPGRYVRLRALTEVNGNPWTSAAEIGVLGTLIQGGPPANQAPNGTINTPTQDISIGTGGTVSFSGTGVDPDNNLPLSYRWTFGTGSGVTDSYLKDPGTVQFNNPGTFTVSFIVTDALGLSDLTPDTRVVTVQNTSNQAPNAVINTPTVSQTVAVGGSISFTGTGTDPDNNFPLTYKWNFGAGSGIPDSTLQNPGAIKFNTSGVFTVSFVVTDALGLSNSTPATRIVTVQSVSNKAPNGTISTPSRNQTIKTGSSVSFTGTGTDPDNNLPLTYKWNFGAGSGISDSTLKNPGVILFNAPGIFTVSLTVTDSFGLSDPTPATRVITVQGNPTSPSTFTGTLIPKANWILLYVDSEEASGENGVAENAFDGSINTIWHTEWSNRNPPPPHEIWIDLGGNFAIDGFRYLPRQDGGVNGQIGMYEFFVSSDGINWGTAVAVGTFANSATEKEVRFTAALGRYVRLRALTEVNGNPWTSAAEIGVLGTQR